MMGDIQHNNTQQKGFKSDIQHNDTQKKGLQETLILTTLSIKG